MATTAEISTDVKKVVNDVYMTPAYVAVGLTDMAVEKMRERNFFDPIEMRKEFSAQAEKAVKQVQKVPAKVVDRGRKMAEQAQADYEVLAERGEQVVDRILHQQATEDLKAQLDNTVAVTKGAMTTARNAVLDTERAAVTTLKTGMTEAENVAAKLADTAREEAAVARTSVRQASARTRAAARRTSTTASEGAKRTSSRAKASATSARKSAEKASDAATAAAEKVGD